MSIDVKTVPTLPVSVNLPVFGELNFSPPSICDFVDAQGGDLVVFLVGNPGGDRAVLLTLGIDHPHLLPEVEFSIIFCPTLIENQEIELTSKTFPSSDPGWQLWQSQCHGAPSIKMLTLAKEVQGTFPPSKSLTAPPAMRSSWPCLGSLSQHCFSNGNQLVEHGGEGEQLRGEQGFELRGIQH